ncbi:hypothetical protein [Pseudarthrobacter sp. S9]|uniref:hypothetical protein n=1 Tax=Pseudarthrobacter sp. S9 TaxID=3418421 RepID=UPI003D0612F2
MDNLYDHNVMSVTLKHCFDSGVLISIGGVADHDISHFDSQALARCRRHGGYSLAALNLRLQRRERIAAWISGS